ncbi:MAG TPA: homoserine O-succinyltransferase, partial [Dongiaceae bacterium]
QICRLLGAAATPVAVTLCVPDSYRSGTAPAGHLASFYRPWRRIRDEHFDGLIVTGAPIETLPFEDITYWSDLVAMLDWARARIASSLYICWAAQAALYHFRGIPKHPCSEKLSGVFRQHVAHPESPMVKGFGADFPVPVSRYTEVRAADLPAVPGLTVLAESPESGLCLIEDRDNGAICMFNHLEYDAGTLREEFLRDRRAGSPAAIPASYFPDDDPGRPPANVWQPWARLFFANWLDTTKQIDLARDSGTAQKPCRPLTLRDALGRRPAETSCDIDFR